MIQAGTMSTGSACTEGVAGEYWISSISSLRNTTLPGVTATFLPTSNSSVPAGALPLNVRPRSSITFWNPRTRFCPCSSWVSASSSGFATSEFDGDAESAIMRTANSSNWVWYSLTPLTPRTASFISATLFW